MESDGDDEGHESRVRVKTEIEEPDPSDGDDDGDHFFSSLTTTHRKQKQMSTSVNAKPQKRTAMSQEEQEKQKEKWKPDRQQQRLRGKKEGKGRQELVTDEHDDDGGGTSVRRKSSRQPIRQAKLKTLVIKDEPESAEEDCDDYADEDYKFNDEEQEDFKMKNRKRTARKSTAGGSSKSPRTKATPSSRKKRVSEMSEEEHAKMLERWRAEARAKRARRSAQVKTEEDQDFDDIADNTSKKRGGRTVIKRENSEGNMSGGGGTSGRSGSTGRRKKRVDEMTEEEREAIREKWKAQGRAKRARQRKQLTPEQRAEENEKRRQRRERAKQAKTEEELEEENRRARERKAAKRAQMTPEQKKEEAQKYAMWRKKRVEAMNDEERAMFRMDQYLAYMARLANKTPEELEKRRQQRLEYHKRRAEKMSAEQVERRNQRQNAYRKNMTPERRARYLERIKETNKRNYAKWKQDPEKWEKMRQTWRETRQRRLMKMAEVGQKKTRKPSSGTSKARRPTTSNSKRQVNRTPEEMQRIRERNTMYRRKSELKSRIKRNLTIQKLLDSGMSHDEIQQQIETPESRQRRLLRIRVAKAKLKLRKGLQGIGAPSEEIEKRLNELEHTYQPVYQFRPYKPRPESWKPIHQSDLTVLEEISKDVQIDVAKAATLISPSAPKPTTSKTPTVTRAPRTRASKTPRQTTGTTNTCDPGGYPPSISSPSAASTCSYVSVAETPEPVNYITPQQYQPTPPQQQHPHFNHFTSPHHQQYPSQTTAAPTYSHQQPPYSLQNILDSITYQESGTFGPPIIATAAATATNQVNHHHHEYHAHHHQNSNSSNQNHYANSYDNHSPPPASPQGSSGGGDNDDYGYSTLPFHNFPSERSRRPGRPRKGDTPSRKKPKDCLKRPGRSTKPCTVCDECGNSVVHIRQHKVYYHNPNYKDKKCQICMEEFPGPAVWHKHYLHAHPDHNPKSAQDSKDKPHMCETCGISFKQKGNLSKHKYYSHGDGQRKENYNKCPLCPHERLFKEKITLYYHMRKEHPEHNRYGQKLECFRCDYSCPRNSMLGAHVQKEHPESFYPCQYCNACKFSKVGLNFHYRRCVKISKEIQEELMANPETLSWDREFLPCEFCNKKVTISALTRHYWDMHKIREIEFPCPHCDKKFKKRDFWAVHMEEMHSISLEEMQDMVRRLNVASREGLVVQRPDGKRTVRGIKRKRAKKGGKKRNITVIAEEDEQLEREGGSEHANPCSMSAITEERKSVSELKRNKTVRRKYEDSGDDDDEEETEGEDSWKGSEQDGASEEENHYQPSSENADFAVKRSSTRLRGRSSGTFRESESASEDEDVD